MVSIFIDNKYTLCYYSIINRAKSRSMLHSYTETHHIVPKSFFTAYNGSLVDNPDINSNIVELTAKEHFICHLLLTKMTTGVFRDKMLFALNRIQHKQHHPCKLNSTLYEKFRIDFAEAQSRLHSGKVVSDETRKKISDAKTGTVLSDETKQKISYAISGRTLSDDHKLNISNGQKGRTSGMLGKKHTDETKAKMSESSPRAMLGKHHSADAKQKMSDARKNKQQTHEHITARVASRLANSNNKHTDETKSKMSLAAKSRSKKVCEHCNKEVSPGNYKRWHSDNCKHNK